MTYTTSRSRAITGGKCPRMRYWQYDYQQRGLLTPGDSLKMDLGIQIHSLLEGELRQNEDPNPKLRILEDYKPQSWEYNSEGTLKEHQFFVEVAKELITPLISRKIKENFNILLVEGVHTPKLCEGITWYSREDALLGTKGENKRWIFSFKTCEKFNPEYKIRDAQYAMQNVSEPWAAMQDGYEDIKGVAMLWFEVGELKESRDLGRFLRMSPLTRPYYDGKNYYWSYRWIGEDGSARQVPKGSKRVFVGDSFSAIDWAEKILRGEVAGSNLESLFYGPVMFDFKPKQMESWFNQQTSIFNGEPYWKMASETTQKVLDSEGIESWRLELDKHYQQRELQCKWCSFTELCYGGDEALTKIGSLYQLKRKTERPEIEDL